MVPYTSLQTLNHLLITLIVNYGVDCKFVIYKQRIKSERTGASATLTIRHGRTIAQTVSHRLPTAAARVQIRVWSCGIFVMDKSGAGAGFLRELRFPLPIYIPSASSQSSSLSPEDGKIGQEWPQCQ
jgi:hypothetical protein